VARFSLLLLRRIKLVLLPFLLCVTPTLWANRQFDSSKAGAEKVDVLSAALGVVTFVVRERREREEEEIYTCR